MSTKNCLGCRHLAIDFGSHHYSEVTPGGPGSMSCAKRHFPEVDCGDHDKEVIAADLDMATTCSDYTPERWVKP